MNDTATEVSDDAFIEGVMIRRCLAWAIDLVMILILMGIVFVVLLLFGLVTLGLGFGAMAVLPFVPFLYHLVSLMRRGSATPGQAMTGLIVRRDADLGPPTASQALLFTVGFYITTATAYVLLLVAPFTVRHRTLHDLVSGLVVVRRRALDAWVGQG